jgi:hypothetical protein
MSLAMIPRGGPSPLDSAVVTIRGDALAVESHLSSASSPTRLSV